ncbi:hypothetical protein ASE07_12115 [Noviherbaspirillum sp. Root189]|nr:hypothetical protein ASE07_12115 [Noviherbaspirillum sp. Root189]
MAIFCGGHYWFFVKRLSVYHIVKAGPNSMADRYEAWREEEHASFRFVSNLAVRPGKCTNARCQDGRQVRLNDHAISAEIA